MRLAFEGVSFSFLGRDIVKDISFGVAGGDIAVLLGPSGSGKSTILNLASASLSPSHGQITRNYARQAMVFQEPRLLPWRTIYQNIAYVLKRANGGRSNQEAIYEAAMLSGLREEDLDKYPALLSGGMAQRAGIARAIAIKPDMIYFDEPFGALDMGSRQSLQDLVIGLSQTHASAILFVTHDLHEALRIATHIWCLTAEPSSINLIAKVPGLPGLRSEADIFEQMMLLKKDPRLNSLIKGRQDAY